MYTLPNSSNHKDNFFTHKFHENFLIKRNRQIQLSNLLHTSISQGKKNIFVYFSIAPEERKPTLTAAEPIDEHHNHSGGHLGGHLEHSTAVGPGNFTHPDYDYFKLTSAATPISASFGGPGFKSQSQHSTMVDGMMSSAFAAAAAAHQDSLSRMTSMTNSIAPHQGHAAHTAGQILGMKYFLCL